MRDLKGRTVVVTGASSGIGPYLARAFADKGANVALVGRSSGRLNEVTAQLNHLGTRAISVAVDLTDPSARAALIEQTEKELGPVDILVNNAGVHYTGPFALLDLEEIDQIVQTNLVAAIHLTRSVLPGMLKRKRGHIIHNAGLAGKVGMPYLAAYSATKYGLVGFNHALQAELRNTGVYSTAMCFGFISRTGMWARFKRRVHPAFGLSSPERVAHLTVRAVQHRWVERVINPIPVRPVVGLWAIAPGLASWMFRTLRVEQFMHDNARSVQADRSILDTGVTSDQSAQWSNGPQLHEALD